MINIEKMEILFSLKDPAKDSFNCLCSTILTKRKNVDYCFEYFKRYKQKNDLDTALYIARRELDLIGKGFNYNLFNRSMLRCIFYSLVGNNVSRVDNLEGIMLILFPNELESYAENPKSFSFQELCGKFSNSNFTLALKPILIDNHGFTNIQKLRNQMEHSTSDNILENDPLIDDEDDCFVNSKLTLSGEKESVVDFAKSLNELLFKIEEQVFDCLMTHGKDCLNDRQNC